MVAILDKLKKIMPSGNRLIEAQRANAELRAQIRGTYREKYKSLVARFDAAQTTTDNERHWSNADALSAEAAASVGVRSRLRNRSRYECQENNPYGKGIILKHAYHLIGRVPRLQMQTANQRFNDFVEQHFEQWTKSVKLGKKLRTMAKSKTVDGEAFAQLVTNERVGSPIKLDLRLIEADQIETPMLVGNDPNYISGIKYDAAGLNPVHYDVLERHPGSLFTLHGKNPLIPRPVSAHEIVHWFREDRPNQKRGIPETATALPLFSQLRRFTLATIAAAETAAEVAGVIKTTSSEVDTEAIDPLEAIELEMRSLLTLPQGWDMNQVKAEHPATTYDMFESSILRQIAQPIAMPFNVAAGDSSKHNFASGRLDHKMYESSIEIERYDLACDQLQQIFAAWYREFKLWAATTRAWNSELPTFDELLFGWFFDAIEHAADPAKEANAENSRLGSGSMTLPEVYARRGKNWRRELKRGAESLGVTVEEYQALIRQKLFGASIAAEPSGPLAEEPQEDPDEEEPEKEEAVATGWHTELSDGR